VPPEFEYSKELAVKEVTPVPPRFTGRVPAVLARSMLREEVATQLGRPVVYELERKPPVLVARAVRAVPLGEPKRSWPSPTAERPVPPPPIPRSPARVFEKVRVPLELVMVVDAVRPLKAVLEVAKMTAPVRVLPGIAIEETPLLIDEVAIH
jgi:hypothetical protein